jgi:HEAT repeat protein
MSFRSVVIEPLQGVGKSAQALLSRVDTALVALAAPFGAQATSSPWRYAVLLGAFALIYLVALVRPPGAPVVLAVGLLGVLAVGRAWVANEKQRARIVKKLENVAPDTLPDLRVSALLAALQVLLLFPLLFREAQGLFEMPAEVAEDRWRSLGAWFGFTLDTISRTLVDLTGLKVLRGRDIKPASREGELLVLAGRTLIDLLLVQGIVRVFAINTLIREAVTALKQDPDITRRLGRRAVGPLLGALKGPDKDVREKAALVLGELKDARAVDGLIAALADAEAEVRWRAAAALGQIGDARAVVPLVDALRDAQESVRSAALHALERMKGADVLSHLMGLLRPTEPGPVRAAAVEALGELPAAEAGDALLAALRDPEEEVRQAAAVALGRRKEARAVEPLRQALDEASNPPWLRGEAARALGQIGDAAALPSLVRGLEGADAFVRKCCAQALGALGDAQALGALGDAQAVAPLVAALPGAEKEVREAVASALGRLKARQALPQLLELLQDAEEPVREAAAEAVAAVGDAEAVEPLAQVLRQGAAPARQLAADLLGKLGGAAAVPPLLAALGDADKEVRETAAWALGEVGDERAAGALAGARQDEEEAVRERAEEALKKIEARRAGAGTKPEE